MGIITLDLRADYRKKQVKILGGGDFFSFSHPNIKTNRFIQLLLHMARITDIEGIGPVNAEKLSQAGIKSVEGLLKACAAKAGRKATAAATEIAESTLLEWTNMADLFRVKGVSSQYAELLKAAGVDTVKELRNRNAANLHAKMVEVNEAKSLVRQLPSPKQVEGYVEQAKGLDAVMTY